MPHIGDKNNFFKNPLGIIGIFLVLTEAIGARDHEKRKDYSNSIVAGGLLVLYDITSKPPATIEYE